MNRRPFAGGAVAQPRGHKEAKMFIGHFTERPYQDPKSGYFGATGLSIKDLTLSN